jgi:short-subunit dehydrogenase
VAVKKKILIIGGASGIGKTLAEILLKKNYRVTITDRHKDKLETVKSQLKKIQPGLLSTLAFDITDRQASLDALDQIDASERLDCIVVSAGTHSAYPIEFITDDVVDSVIDINLSAHIKLVRDILPKIKNGGKIIGLSSIAAGLGIPMSSMYSASKAGLEGFYESLSMEVSYRNIKAILIQPGNVNTGFNETGNDYRPTGNRFVDEGYGKVVSSIDSSKGMNPEVVAKVIHKAIESPSPKFCYIVGMNALKAHWAKRLLGRDLALKVMAKYFGL